MKLVLKHQAGKHSQKTHGRWRKTSLYAGAEGKAAESKLKKQPSGRKFVAGNTPRDEVAREVWDKFSPNVESRAVFSVGGGLKTSPAGSKNAKLFTTSDRELSGLGQPSMTSQVHDWVMSKATGGFGMPLKGGGTGYGLGNGASIEAYRKPNTLIGPQTWWYISNG